MPSEASKTNIELFQEITYKNPSDLIIGQLKTLISDGSLRPGDKLPSERELSKQFSIGRGYIRKAIQTLEFYGILKTHPQSGTFVSSLGVKSLEGLISNILRLEKNDFKSLIETRKILETQTAALAALRATDEDIKMLELAHEEFRQQVEAGVSGLEDDLMFHLKISECSRNSVLSSLIGMITPGLLQMSRDLNTCDQGRYRDAFFEHENILNAIKARDKEKAESAMREHMSNTKVHKEVL